MKMKASALILSIVVFVFLFSTKAFAVTGDVIVTQSGQSVPDATVIIETAEGESIGETRTDSEGRAKLNLSEGAIKKPEVVKVTEADGNTTTFPVRVSSMPAKSFEIPSKALSLVSLDLDGGISVFDKDVVSVIDKAALPINVGDNSAVGTSARVKQKAMKQAGGMLGSALGGISRGMFGGGGGGDSKTKEPKQCKDPVSDNFKRVFADPATGTKIRVGGQMTSKGLHISTTILDSPDKGTFQTVYLMDDKGNKAGPVRYEIYEH